MHGQPGDGPAGVEESGLTLALAMDPRLAEVWSCLFSANLDPQDLAAQIGWFLRMAYLRGYHDGLCEPEAGSLYRELGMRVPQRRRPTTSRPGPNQASTSERNRHDH